MAPHRLPSKGGGANLRHQAAAAAIWRRRRQAGRPAAHNQGRDAVCGQSAAGCRRHCRRCDGGVELARQQCEQRQLPLLGRCGGGGDGGAEAAAAALGRSQQGCPPRLFGAALPLAARSLRELGVAAAGVRREWG